MSTVTVSHVPTTVSAEKLQEFFAFCGTINSVNDIGPDGLGYHKFQVNFASEKALSTAVLLNEAELDGVAISVSTDSLPSYAEVPHKEAGAVASGATEDYKTQDLTRTGDESYDDISQEEKPKLAILAQLLALGYKVSDDLIAKAVEIDNLKGISTKFTSFLSSLDKRFLHSLDPESTTSKNFNKAQNLFGSLSSQIQNNSYTQRLQHYFDRASASPYGMKVNDFYKLVTKEVKDVHLEATRLYNLKKAESANAGTTGTTGTTETQPVASTTPATTLTEKPPVTSEKTT